MTLATLTARYDALTLTCTELSREIRKADYQTIRYAVADFQKANEERVKLMRLLNLVPAGM